MSVKRTWTGRLGAAAVAAGVVLAPAGASAEQTSPTGKGIAGGAMLGAEVVMITEGIIGVESWWPYLLFGAVGAGGGAVGGYFVEQTGKAEPALYMFAGGLALVVPALVVTLNATAYNPEADLDEDLVVEEGGDEGAAPAGEEGAPSPEGGAPAAPLPPGAAPGPAPAPAPGPTGVLGPTGVPGPTGGARRFAPMAVLGLDLWSPGVGITAGVPNVEVRPTYTPDEQARFGVAQIAEVQVPMLAGRF